jgi:hypothetical protein
MKNPFEKGHFLWFVSLCKQRNEQEKVFYKNILVMYNRLILKTIGGTCPEHFNFAQYKLCRGLHPGFRKTEIPNFHSIAIAKEDSISKRRMNLEWVNEGN